MTETSGREPHYEKILPSLKDNTVSVLRDDEASAPESTVFHSERELESVSSHLPVPRLVDI